MCKRIYKIPIFLHNPDCRPGEPAGFEATEASLARIHTEPDDSFGYTVQLYRDLFYFSVFTFCTLLHFERYTLDPFVRKARTLT